MESCQRRLSHSSGGCTDSIGQTSQNLNHIRQMDVSTKVGSTYFELPTSTHKDGVKCGKLLEIPEKKTSNPPNLVQMMLVWASLFHLMLV